MPSLSEPTVSLSALVEYHHEVLAPDFQRVFERLDRMAAQIRRVADVLDRVDELGLRFEGAENLLSQLAEQILELRTEGAVIVPPSHH